MTTIRQFQHPEVAKSCLANDHWVEIKILLPPEIARWLSDDWPNRSESAAERAMSVDAIIHIMLTGEYERMKGHCYLTDRQVKAAFNG